MCILYKKSFVKKFQLGDNKPKKNSKARVFQWFIELNPKRNQRHALGINYKLKVTKLVVQFPYYPNLL